MKILLFLNFIFLGSVISFSQNITTVDVPYFNNSYYNGKVTINQDLQIENYIETFVGLNKKRRGFYGYRVKIYAQNHPNARNQANSERLKFNEANNKQKAYVTFVEPNFEVHVGDFISRFEAVAFLKEISEQYPEAYVIKTIINFPARETTTE
jgi:hypothetical protein